MIVRRRALPALTVEDQLPAVFGEDFGNLRYRQHQVHGARQDRAARHAVILGLVGILGDDEPALLLDRLQSEAAVAAGSRRITQIARSPSSSASERRKKSNGRRAP